MPGGAFCPDKGAGEFLNAFREGAGAELTPRPPQLRGRGALGLGSKRGGKLRALGGGSTEEKEGKVQDLEAGKKINSKT